MNEERFRNKYSKCYIVDILISKKVEK